VATGLIAVARWTHLTRFSPVRLLGCLVHSRPDHPATLGAGLALHFMLGAAVFPAAYVVFFELLGEASVLAGLAGGAVHGLAAGLAVPAVWRRTRCARARRFPEPGIFARKLGTLTPMGFLIVHCLYGATLGYIYAVPG
jgi:hypothetical protein